MMMRLKHFSDLMPTLICHLVFDTKQQLDLRLKSILDTFGELIAQYQVYKSKIIKETPRVLPSTHKLERESVMNSLDKRPIDDPDYIQRLMRQSRDDQARKILARFGQF